MRSVGNLSRSKFAISTSYSISDLNRNRMAASFLACRASPLIGQTRTFFSTYGKTSRPRMAMSKFGNKSIGRPFPVQPGEVTAMREVPDSITKPDYALTGIPSEVSDPHSIRVYDQEEIVRARAAARLARKMLDFANSLAIQPNKYSTEDIDMLTHQEIINHGAYPSPINYRGFPKAICTSVNEVVCHGIPDSRVIEAGDVVSIDVSLYLDGMHGDNCGTVISGDPDLAHSDESVVMLVKATQLALDESIAACKPGECISTIGNTIESVAANNDLRIIHEFCGHGTGEKLHMPPFVRHFRNRDRVEMVPGMIFTIEPIFVEGSRRMHIWQDGWTAATLDGGLGAQFEHEVLITEDGCEVLTVQA